MKINHRHYMLLFFAILSIGVVGYGYYFVYSKTVIQAEHYISANNEVLNEDKKRNNEQEIMKVFNSSKDSRVKIMSFFVHEDKVVEFIEMMEKVGTDSNTNLELSSILNEDDKVKVKINTKGSWSGIMKALLLIENLPLSIHINNVALNVSDVSAKEGSTWSLTLDIEALSIKK